MMQVPHRGRQHHDIPWRKAAFEDQFSHALTVPEGKPFAPAISPSPQGLAPRFDSCFQPRSRFYALESGTGGGASVSGGGLTLGSGGGELSARMICKRLRTGLGLNPA